MEGLYCENRLRLSEADTETRLHLGQSGFTALTFWPVCKGFSNDVRALYSPWAMVT